MENANQTTDTLVPRVPPINIPKQEIKKEEAEYVKRLNELDNQQTEEGEYFPGDEGFLPNAAIDVSEPCKKLPSLRPFSELPNRRKKSPEKSPVIIEEDSAPSETCCPAFFANFRDMFTSLGFCGNKPL